MPVYLRRWLGFSLLILTVLALRWGGLHRNIWNLDEGATFTMAEQVRAGDVIYRDAADNRAPLVPYVKAFILSVVGDWNLYGAHVVVAFMIGLSGCFIVCTFRRLGQEAIGWVSGVCFVIIGFILVGADDVMAAHTEWFVVFFSTLGFLCFAHAWMGGRWLWALFGGISFGLSAMAKQPALVDFGVTWVICVLGFVFQAGRRRDFFCLLLLMLLGWALVFVVTVAYFVANHAYQDFVFYAWTYNTKYYVPEIPRAERLMAAPRIFEDIWNRLPLVLAVCGLGSVFLLIQASAGLFRRHALEVRVVPWLILGCAAAGFVSTGISGRTFGHYAIQAAPGIAMATGWVFVSLWNLVRRRHTLRWCTFGFFAAYAICLLIPTIERALHLQPDDSIFPTLGQVIRRHTTPSERIFVWGYTPDLYVAAKRLPASRYIYTNYVTGMIPWTNLDADTDTTYAIVPDGPKLLLQDLNARPPALIVDTRKDRGYLKYPLIEQRGLWSYIQKNYAEIARDEVARLDYGFYKRVEPASNQAFPFGLKTSDQVVLSGASVAVSGTQRYEASAPAGTTYLGLYLDGRLYRRVASNPAGIASMAFFVLEDALAAGRHTLQLVAEGPSIAASQPLILTIDPAYVDSTPVGGPTIQFEGIDLRPIESSRPVASIGQDHWQAHAPSRITYRRPASMGTIQFTFGFMPGAYDGTNPRGTSGARAIVEFVDDATGKKNRLFDRMLYPKSNPNDRGLQTGRVELPFNRNGLLLFRFQLVGNNDPAYCWTYWGTFKAESSSLSIAHAGAFILPTALEAPLGLTKTDVNGIPAVFIHAPSKVDFDLPPESHRFVGHFGLLDSSWNGSKQTRGVVFEVRLRRADGTAEVLFSRTLNPAYQEKDRGPQPLSVQLPEKAAGTLELIARAAYPPDNSYGYSYWQRLAIDELPIDVPAGSRVISAIREQARYGLSIAGEDDKPVIFAHSPTAITFPLDAALTGIEGDFGIMNGAYTGKNNTEGVTFIIETVNPAGVTQEIFRRTLQPLSVPADRGFFHFSVPLKPSAGDHLVLRTDPAVSGHDAYTWSFWSGLHFNVVAPTQ